MENIGEFKDWKEVTKKAKELLEEKKIKTVRFCSHENCQTLYYDEKDTTLFYSVRNEKSLKEIIIKNEKEYSHSSKFELFILIKLFCGETPVLVIVCHE